MQGLAGPPSSLGGGSTVLYLSSAQQKSHGHGLGSQLWGALRCLPWMLALLGCESPAKGLCGGFSSGGPTLSLGCGYCTRVSGPSCSMAASPRGRHALAALHSTDTVHTVSSGLDVMLHSLPSPVVVV